MKRRGRGLAGFVEDEGCLVTGVVRRDIPSSIREMNSTLIAPFIPLFLSLSISFHFPHVLSVYPFPACAFFFPPPPNSTFFPVFLFLTFFKLKSRENLQTSDFLRLYCHIRVKIFNNKKNYLKFEKNLMTRFGFSKHLRPL